MCVGTAADGGADAGGVTAVASVAAAFADAAGFGGGVAILVVGSDVATEAASGRTDGASAGDD